MSTRPLKTSATPNDASPSEPLIGIETMLVELDHASWRERWSQKMFVGLVLLAVSAIVGAVLCWRELLSELQ